MISNAFLDKTAGLMPLTRLVVCDKSTEAPYSGLYNKVVIEGTYLCRRCGLALFRANSQFTAGCGWPSFDAEIAGTVTQILDPDGYRMEIVCRRCEGHLGHIFTGEHLTIKNCRYCVNSLSLDFVASNTVLDTEEAIVAGGCFWGVEYYLNLIPGVLKIEVGYTGGNVTEPTYKHVCSGDTGHYEAARILFDTAITNYATVLKRFFEIHDPTQKNGQGPDIGQQYQSAVFVYNQSQEEDAKQLLQTLHNRGYLTATQLIPALPFWPAEDYHQQYYAKNNKKPYCHQPVLRFD